VLGHASITTTERYALLRPDLFVPADYEVVKIDLETRGGDVVPIAARVAESGTFGYAAATVLPDGGPNRAVSS